MTDSHASSRPSSSLSSQPEVKLEDNALTRLRSLLDSDQASLDGCTQQNMLTYIFQDFEFCLSQSKNSLGSAQKLLLQSLAKHFSLKRKKDNDDDDQDEEPTPKKPRGPHPHHPWRRVLSISSLTLDAPLEQYLDTHGSADPQGFFDDLSRLHQPAITTQHHDTITAADPATAPSGSSSSSNPTDTPGQGNTLRPSAKGTAFLALIQYTHILTARMVQDRPRWLFLMLLYYDIAHLAFPEVRRFGSLALTDIKALLGGSVEEEAGEMLLLGGGGTPHRGRAAATAAAAAAGAGSSSNGTSITLHQLNEWTRCGQKCSEICADFGAGALFYLSELFSKDFLLHKFTSSGQYHDEAWEHLTDLDLKGVAISSGATELGEGIRRVLVAPFVLG